MALSKNSLQFLKLLQADSNFIALLDDMDTNKVFGGEEVGRWSPTNRVSHEDRIYDDGLQMGRSQVLSIFRGKNL